MVGALIRERRRSLGLSQEQLAERLEMHQTYLSRLERGEVDLPQRATLEKLAKELGVTLPEFYRAAGVLDPLPPDVMPPVPPREDRTEDRAWEPARIVAYVESHPDERFRAELAEEAEYMSPEDYTEYCLEIFKAWTSNGHLATRTARQVRHRFDVTKRRNVG